MTAAPTLSAAAFAARWRANARREHASSQGHCIDLCRLLGVPTPNVAGRTGDWYTFEAGAERLSAGGRGRADVWKREHSGWEYTGVGRRCDRSQLQRRPRRAVATCELTASAPC